MSQENNAETVVVLDLATLRIDTDQGWGSVTAAETGEVLHSGPCSHGQRGVAELLDSAAATARLWRAGTWCRVAFYNPHTARVSLGTAVDGVVLYCGAPVPLDASGTVGVYDHDNEVLFLHDTIFEVEQPDRDTVIGQLLAHEM